MPLRRARLGVVATALACAACTDPAPAGRGVAWPEANALFHREARFLGADGAYSVDLGGGRVLWLFGDTLVARDRDHPHETAAFLRNSVALQTGYDPLTAYIRHYWRSEDDDPRSFFPEPSEESWLWPAHGVRVGDSLVLFFELLHDEGEPGPWSFAGGGWTAAVVENPDDAVPGWRVVPATLPEGADAGGDEVLGEACVVDGAHLYAFGTRGDAHAVVLARFPLAEAAAGDLRGVERYCGGGRWDGSCGAATLFSIGAPEFSVHRDARLGRWLWVASGGFGAAPVVWRAAPALTGPWSDPVDVFRPPEASRDGAFVYAAKAHPELEAEGGDLVVTYVPSSFEGAPASLDGVYYFPFFAKIAPE